MIYKGICEDVCRHVRVGRCDDAYTDDGYTLVEVLVALSLVALLSVGLVSGIGTGTRVWELADARSRSLSEAVVFDDVVRRHLQKAVPVVLGVGTRRSAIFFDGTSTRIRFFTMASAGVGSRGIFGEELEFRPADARSGVSSSASSGAGGGIVVLRRAREALRQSGQSPQTWDVTSFPHSGGDLTFEYYGIQSNENRARWHESWRENNALPKLIRLSSGAEDGPFALIVRPRLMSLVIRVPVQSVDEFFHEGGV